MDSLITAAAQALARGAPLDALNCTALRKDPPAVALRGMAMAQLGDLAKAKELLRRAAGAFEPREPVSCARCRLAEAEIALVQREINVPMRNLEDARTQLIRHGDVTNAAHAGYLHSRLMLLIGRLDEAQAILESLDPVLLPPASRPGAWLVAAGLAMRRIETAPARAALSKAALAAKQTGIAALVAEVDRAVQAFEAPAAALLAKGEERLLALGEVEALIASDTLIVDALRSLVRLQGELVLLSGRPVLFALLRTLAEAWPGDVSREILLARAFGARHADESHRARLRVEIGRLRAEISAFAEILATDNGFVLRPRGASRVVMLLPPQEEDHAEVRALLADGQAWSSSALALALNVSPRTVQRALEALAAAGKAESVGRGRARRWMARQVPGFPTSLLLPGPLTPA